jgi:Flp pilus assembly protein TadD
MNPIDFTVATRDFDVYLLPEEARAAGTPAFEHAVILFFAEQFAGMGGKTFVSVDAEQIHVQWIPDSASEDPMDYVVNLLTTGRSKEAKPLLEAMLLADPTDTTVLYNLGMVESDAGELEHAIRHLSELVRIDPQNADGHVALGVAHQRSGDTEAAKHSLRTAVSVDPKNGYAHRNLGAILGRAGDMTGALSHLEEAFKLMPNDDASVFGYAQALEGTGKDADLDRADDLYKQLIARSPESPISERAKKARSNIAQKVMREKTGGALNMAVVMYCVDALQRFAKMTPGERQNLVFEIAMLGQSGLDTNDPTPKYRLRSIPDKAFSGLQLTSIMFVGFRQIKPDLDTGLDYAREYQAALQMTQDGSSSPS